MILSALRQIPLMAAAAAPEAGDPATVTVVVTGLSLVFAILILLWVILLIEGKIFASIDQKKKAKEAQEKAQASAPQSAPAVQPAAPAAPVVQDGIPPEVVAAITAAVSQIEGGRYTLRSVSTSQSGRGQWGLAGVISYTEPF